MRSHLCDLSASSVTCSSPTRAVLTGVSFPGWATFSDAFGQAHTPRTPACKRELPLLLKRQQLRRLFSASCSVSLELHCVKIFFNEGGWAKAKIIASRKPPPPDNRSDTKERDLRRRDAQDD